MIVNEQASNHFYRWEKFPVSKQKEEELVPSAVLQARNFLHLIPYAQAGISLIFLAKPFGGKEIEPTILRFRSFSTNHI